MRLQYLCEKLASKLLGKTGTIVECMTSPFAGVNGAPKKGELCYVGLAKNNGYIHLSKYNEGWIATNFRKAQA